MFLGHFALGVAAKLATPELPIWALFLTALFGLMAYSDFARLPV